MGAEIGLDPGGSGDTGGAGTGAFKGFFDPEFPDFPRPAEPGSTVTIAVDCRLGSAALLATTSIFVGRSTAGAVKAPSSDILPNFEVQVTSE